ncbi:hypothetical protein [uncultured Desulfosarcina sp.]
MDELLKRGILKSGDNVMFIGLGAGLTYDGDINRRPE